MKNSAQHELQDAVLEDAKERAQQLSRPDDGERPDDSLPRAPLDRSEEEGPGPAEGRTDNKAGG